MLLCVLGVLCGYLFCNPNYEQLASYDVKIVGMDVPRTGLWRRVAGALGWNRTSYLMMSGFVLLLFIIGYAWWPLVVEYWSSYNPAYPWWRQMDWLLLGNFAGMSLLIMARADLRHDLPVVFVGLAGGLTIEAWGTQTRLWTYYTLERPPLWIVPAWPIASLAIDRLFRLLMRWTGRVPKRWIGWIYGLVFAGFYAYMVVFVWPTRERSLTLMALFLCAFLILTPRNPRAMLLTFVAGSALGYFLELWGTTRACWTYYTLQTPPFFAVLAHGMAAVAFWRVVEVMRIFGRKMPGGRIPPTPPC
jgi:MFS family permease